MLVDCYPNPKTPYFCYGYRVDPAKSHMKDIGAPAPTKDLPISSIYTWDTFPTAFFPRNEQASKALKSHGTDTHRSPNSLLHKGHSWIPRATL